MKQNDRIARVVVIGPECTGKSTLCAGLAEALCTAWVPEYARAYLESIGRPYVEEDLLTIARGQLALEDRLAGEAKDLLICDTDLHVIRVWSEHSYGRVDTEVLREIAIRNYDLYLLTDIDIPWQYDPLREHPQPDERLYFYRQYHDTVIHSGIPWVNISGDPKKRLQTALEAIRERFVF